MYRICALQYYTKDRNHPGHKTTRLCKALGLANERVAGARIDRMFKRDLANICVPLERGTCFINLHL